MLGARPLPTVTCPRCGRGVKLNRRGVMKAHRVRKGAEEWCVSGVHLHTAQNEKSEKLTAVVGKLRLAVRMIALLESVVPADKVPSDYPLDGLESIQKTLTLKG